MSYLVEYKDILDSIAADTDKAVIAANIKTAATKYPDLMVYNPVEMPHLYMLAAKSAAPAVSKYDYYERVVGKEPSGDDIIHIEIWPYADIDGHKVYTIPMAYHVASVNNHGFGFIPVEKWDDAMYDDGIPFSVIRDVRYYLSSKPPIYW